MKFYLAAHFERASEMQEYAKLLRAEGYRVCSSWHETELQKEAADEKALAEHPDDYRQFAITDLAEVNRSDVLLLFSGAGRGGRHVEYGYAIALGIPAIVIGHREHVFHTICHKLYPDFQSFLKEYSIDQF